MYTCPLCEQTNSQLFYQDKHRPYYRCEHCMLVFVPEEYRLDAEREKAFYDLHNNDPLDDGYRRFLSRMSIPMTERLVESQHGLDFGCGPGPTLSLLLEEQGHKVALYDIYYHPDTKVLEHEYDFMTATEVIEHLYQPNLVWQQWLSLVKAGGWLGIMTKLVIDKDAFASWHYKNDLTHVCFYSRETFQHLAERDNLQLEFIGNDVILLRKPQ
ncbi:class I SAM-dependent methyltransferase [Vibrio hannami]|uniref:class I SAM-dependent methyltransferase n=1 Tax=Vibrio hannami TaxID=2717094 RepID=UPI0024100095|nr:class I SAM-dependent methyltransferase [Vibrio hannami]MDG3086829.1 class I SAM-dependent methyltransferase [Vibrio hannami]